MLEVMIVLSVWLNVVNDLLVIVDRIVFGFGMCSRFVG